MWSFYPSTLRKDDMQIHEVFHILQKKKEPFHDTEVLKFPDNSFFETVTHSLYWRVGVTWALKTAFLQKGSKTTCGGPIRHTLRFLSVETCDF